MFGLWELYIMNYYLEIFLEKAMTMKKEFKIFYKKAYNFRPILEFLNKVENF